MRGSARVQLVTPSPEKPGGQTHVQEPGVLVQVACSPLISLLAQQLPLFSRHSLISVTQAVSKAPRGEDDQVMRAPMQPGMPKIGQPKPK